MRTLSIVAALLTSVATPSLALDFGNGFSVEGKVEVEYFDSGSFSGETALVGDVDLGYQSATTGFGGFIGIDSFFADGSDQQVFYGALSYSGDFGTFQIGAPRVALDDYLRSPTLGGLEFLEYGELGALTGSYLSIVALAFEETPEGLRYDGTFGAASLGVSYHRIGDGGSNSEVLTAGLNYALGSSVLVAGLETLSISGNRRTSFFLGGEATIEQFVLGIQYSQPDAVSNDVDAIELYGVYSPTDALDITATYLNLDAGTNDTDAYGISARYSFAYGGFVEAGFGEFDGSGNSNQANLGLGIQF